jgi:DNA adenine methylase
MLKKAKLKPVLKWAGGKTSELPIIHKYMPSEFDNFYEPFIGGGAVWLTISNEHKMFVNDFSVDLVNLYNCIKEENKDFYNFISAFNELWLELSKFSIKNTKELVNSYKKYKQNTNKDELSKSVTDLFTPFFQNNSYFSKLNVFTNSQTINSESLLKNTIPKIVKLHQTEEKRGLLPEEDYILNIETIFKNSAYLLLRNLYNTFLTKKENYSKGVESAIYYLMRDLAYSGMFRFNSNGEFNVPYGGMSYNSKNFKNKLDLVQNKELIEHFNHSTINNGDFYEFFNKYPPKSNDFIFLDPPYDSEFSNYEGNEFSKKDQTRLADYLIKECKGKWMVVIKNTDFIYSLYNQPGIEIITFDKKYAVSFMDRNNQEVTHLLIKNYKE